MIRHRKPFAQRHGGAFTLIELLIVMVLLGALLGMISAAAVVVRSRARVAATAAEIAKLDQALRSYRERFGEFPPDCVFVNGDGDMPELEGWGETQDRRAMANHVSRMFPHLRLADSERDPVQTNPRAWADLRARVQKSLGLDISRLYPPTALVFWLGGVPEVDRATRRPTGRLLGFSTNPSNPFDSTTTKRIGPFFDFDPARLQVTDTGWMHYLPSCTSQSGRAPYVYFRAPYHYALGTRVVPRRWRLRFNHGFTTEDLGVPSAAPVSRVRPYYHGSVDGKSQAWFNPQSFQLICAGADDKYGGIAEDVGGTSGMVAAPHFPLRDNTVGGHEDNQTNFCRGVLEDLVK
jgi:prepilin-type N-terminal cleavage/methylation domain-containing protein